jgi:FtsP/CotA-like multicopper oxidase with cupredoxin domain
VNHLKVPTSIHWHGLVLPNPMDGVPFVTMLGARTTLSF